MDSNSIPYKYLPKTKDCIYINYLEMKGLIIVPTFGIKEDEVAVKMIGQLFPDHEIFTVNSSVIAKKAVF